MYTQVVREKFVSQLDSEHSKIKEAAVGDFHLLVRETGSDVFIEAVTNRVAITVQTNAGYKTGKKF